MLKSTAMVGKDVINSNDGKVLGKVNKIVADGKARNAALLLDDGSVICSQSVRAVKNNVCVDGYVNADFRIDADSKHVYDTAGKYLGQVHCAVFNKNMKVRHFEINGQKYLPSRVSALGDIMLIKTPSAKPSQSRAKPKAAVPSQKPVTTFRHTGDFSFLIGKRCDKNITNFQGEIMVKENAWITKDILRQAKVNGKLTELSLHCR
ncbi:MAG: hypothetical protein NC350_01425 [Corallococcus sp.]|nr:hypothetical protein [Corallococcus sp.]